MNELIKVTENENKEPVMSGIELHKFLEVGTSYKKWIDRMLEYGFVENVDFTLFVQKRPSSNASGIQYSTDHILKLDTAKEISMIQRSEKGKQARQYFIQIEKEYNSPEKIMKRALLIADEMIKKLETENEVLKPKGLFADSVSTSNTTILVSELAKILKGNGIEIGGNRLFTWLRDNKYLISRKGTDWNMPTQTSMDKGLFIIKETAINHSDGHVSVNKTPKVTGKGQIYFVNKFLEENQM